MNRNNLTQKPSESYSAGFNARISKKDFLSKPNNYTNDWYFGWIHSDNKFKTITEK